MEDFSKLTPIELQVKINDTKTRHDLLKEEIVVETKEVDRIAIIINEKLIRLEAIEHQYVTLIEEMNNR